MLTSYYGNRHGSVKNDDENVSRTRAVESARPRDRMQNELDTGIIGNRGGRLDSGREAKLLQLYLPVSIILTLAFLVGNIRFYSIVLYIIVGW